MRIVIDYDLCEGNAVCMQLVPEVFEVRDDGDLFVLDERPPEELRSRLADATRSCPRGAITIEEGPTR